MTGHLLGGWVVLAVAAWSAPRAILAQAPPLVAGVIGGYTTTKHVWSPDADAHGVAGLVLGGFVDVQTPLSWLTAGAEATYSQRGSDVMLDGGGMSVPGGIRADYLTFMIRVRAALALGPARLHVAGGPMTDFVIRSRLDALLIQVLEEERAAPFGVSAGAGVGVFVTSSTFVEVEARIVEGLQAAYAGDLISVRSRSRELVARVGLLVGR